MKYDTLYAVGAMVVGVGIGGLRPVTPSDAKWTIVYGAAICVLSVGASIYAAVREARRKRGER